MRLTLFALLTAALLCAQSPAQEPAKMQLTSASFEHGKPIPQRHAYRGEGQNLQPPLTWSGAPGAARSFALVCDDPDAPRPMPWVHWVLYNLPATVSALAEGKTAAGTEGTSDFKETGWGGPFPPRGHGRHRYFFRLYALDADLNLKPGLTRDGLMKALEGHIVVTAELMGTYERK